MPKYTVTCNVGVMLVPERLGPQWQIIPQTALWETDGLGHGTQSQILV